MNRINFEIGEDLDRGTSIYKYVTLNQFMSLVERDITYLTRLSNWDDTWEAPNRNIPVMRDSGELEMPYYNISSDLFGQCWTLKEESDAMWRIYSPSKDGIKLKTSVGKLELIEGLEMSLVSKVHYYDELKDGIEHSESMVSSLPKFLGHGLIKRKAFDHEMEVRLLTLNEDRFVGDKVTKENYIEFKVDVKELIEEIVIDPRASSYYIETLQNYCKRIGINTVPKKSELYCTDIHGRTNLYVKYVPIK